MIEIYVQGEMIDLPSDLSFDYSAENRLITSADGYSLGIDIPLADSVVNSRIFGAVWRMDADIYSLRYPAQLITPQVQLRGVVMIVGVSEKLLTIQFLEGRSQQNSELSFEESFINELSLGYTHLPTAGRSIPVDEAFHRYGEDAMGKPADAIALPWVIRDSGELVHNAIALKGNVLSWSPQWFWKCHPDRLAHKPVQENISYMPYLLTVAIRVADAMGYSHDFSAWENDAPKRNLVVCNTIPASLHLRDWSWQLPHWSVNEFFENIETILEGEFDIDHTAKSITFRLTADIIGSTEPEILESVVDEFEVDVDIDDDEFKSETDLTKNIGYADNSSSQWALRSCDWFIRRRLRESANYAGDDTRGEAESNYHRPEGAYPSDPAPYLNGQKRLIFFDTIEDMISELRKYKYSTSYSGYPFEAIFYARDVKCYFCLKSVDLVKVDDNFESNYPDYSGDRALYNLVSGFAYYVYNLAVLNDFGDFIVRDDDEAQRVELKTVPVPVDAIGTNANAIFLPYSADESLEDGSSIAIDPDDQDTWIQPSPVREVNAGDNRRHEYYDKLYIGYWTGGIDYRNMVPVTSNVHVYSDFRVFVTEHKNLRLNQSFDRGTADILSIDERKLYKISFLSDQLPNPRAIFFIRGKKYLCRKLDISFTAQGMSKLMKGEFYRL